MQKNFPKDAEFAICSESGYWQEINLTQHYPDGMPIGEKPDIIGNLYKIVLRPRSLVSFMAAMFWFDAYQQRNEQLVTLILPFIPGSRQDRLNPEGDFLFTARSIAEEINAREFDKVIVLDPHSEVAPALIDRCQVIHFPSNFRESINADRYIGVIAPDGGAVKRAGFAAEILQLPVFHAWKKRDVATGKLAGFGCESLRPGHYLVVDDICDGGGTFIGLMQTLPRGIVADLYVSHGLFTQGTSKLVNHFESVYTTDSVLADRPGVKIVSLTSHLFHG